MRETYSVNEAAEVLGICRCKAYEAVRDGSIPALRFGRRIRVPKCAMEKLLHEASNARRNVEAT